MSQREDDARLERELRDLLRDRDPGPAPYGLRERVDRLAGTPPESGRRRRGVLPAIAGLAAGLALLVVALAASRTQSGPVAASPVPTAATPSFDPYLVGPGIGPAADNAGLLAAVLACCLVLAVTAAIATGRRRLIPCILLVPVLAYLATSLVSASFHTFLSAPRLNIQPAVMPRGSDVTVWYVVAPADGPYVAGLGVVNDGPVSLRLEGIVGDPTPPFDTLRSWTAVWMDGSSGGGASGPARPFEPIDLAPGEYVMLWFVGRADGCAVGSTMTATELAGGGFAYRQSGIRFRYSVLGWAHTVPFEPPVRIVIPSANNCEARELTPMESPSPATP